MTPCYRSGEGFICTTTEEGYAAMVMEDDEPTERTRLILVSEDILESWVTRTEDGRRITAEWGEQKPEGWYEPTFTATDDGMTVTTTERAATGAAVGRLPDFARLEKVGDHWWVFLYATQTDLDHAFAHDSKWTVAMSRSTLPKAIAAALEGSER